MLLVRATPFLRSLAIAPLAVAIWSVASAGVVRTSDGQTIEGTLSFNRDGLLHVKTASGEERTLELQKISRATFAPGSFFSGGSTLPNGWTATDYGDARGWARLDTNTFALRVDGHSTNALACHFVARAMPSDGQLTVRVEEIGGTGLTHAGVMIRAQDASVFAALSLGSDGRIWLQRRPEADKKEVKLTRGPLAQMPVLLRLQKKEKAVSALYSFDNKVWETMATEPIKIASERTWREGEGDLRLSRASCGVFISSRGAQTRGTARVTALFMTQQGLLGEYFAGREFGNLRMARVDPQVRFNWGAGSPDPALESDNFSVRWTGKLLPQRSGPHTFYVDADDAARLWVDGREFALGNLRRADRELHLVATALTRGQPVDLKLEFEEINGPAAIRLAWAPHRQKPEIIGMTNFHYMFTGAKSPESIALARMSNAGPSVRGVLLRNGTFIAGTITKADESAVRISFAGFTNRAVLNNRVARIVLRPPRLNLPFESVRGRGGVFVKSGDFFESEFRGIDHSSLTVSSVLFGLKKYWIEGGEPVVVLLNDPVPASPAFALHLLDGSIVHADKVEAGPDELKVEDSILGRLSIPSGELFEMRRPGASAAAVSQAQ